MVSAKRIAQCADGSFLVGSPLSCPALAENRHPAAHSAFTLIELLVVISIIAVLAAMLLPTLAKGKSEAQSAVCKNHLQQMGLSMQMYVIDNKAYPFYENYDSNQFPSMIWENALHLYYPLAWTNRAFHCPAYTGGIISTLGSYGYNAWGVAEDFFRGLGVTTSSRSRPT